MRLISTTVSNDGANALLRYLCPVFLESEYDIILTAIYGLNLVIHQLFNSKSAIKLKLKTSTVFCEK